MNKYLISSLSLIALAQAASAAQIEYTIDFIGKKPPGKMFITLLDQDHPNWHYQKGTVQKESGQDTFTVDNYNGLYSKVLFAFAHGFTVCTDTDGKNPLQHISLKHDHDILRLALTVQYATVIPTKEDYWLLKCRKAG